MLEGIICPVCGATLKEEDLRESLVCVHCKTDLHNRNYLDFLEYLMTNGIVENLDFFDTDVYQEDIERLDPEDEEEVDPSEYEKKKDNFSLYENEMVANTTEEDTMDYEEFEGLDEDWEEFNRREYDSF
jgi:hypothetical protein